MDQKRSKRKTICGWGQRVMRKEKMEGGQFEEVRMKEKIKKVWSKEEEKENYEKRESDRRKKEGQNKTGKLRKKGIDSEISQGCV